MPAAALVPTSVLRVLLFHRHVRVGRASGEFSSTSPSRLIASFQARNAIFIWSIGRSVGAREDGERLPPADVADLAASDASGQESHLGGIASVARALKG